VVRCGLPLDDSATEATDPIIVVEVVSPCLPLLPKARLRQQVGRLVPNPSVRHYLIVKTENQAIIHHQRNEAGDIATHVIRDGVIRLDPPGLIVTGLFVQ
jgi:Uma2 family endonuclease